MIWQLVNDAVEDNKGTMPMNNPSLSWLQESKREELPMKNVVKYKKGISTIDLN